MKLIESKTLATAAASIEFTSIPQDATDLVLLMSGRSARTSDGRDEVFIRFNGDSGANYTNRALRGSGSAADSVTNPTTSISRVNLPSSTTTSNTFGNGIIYILNYTALVAKSVSVDNVMENNATFSFQEIVAGLWNNTAAITSISFTPEVANFEAGSTISLYKITKGSDGIVTTSP